MQKKHASTREAALAHDLASHSHIAYWVRQWQGTELHEMLETCEDLPGTEIVEVAAPAPATAAATV